MQLCGSMIAMVAVTSKSSTEPLDQTDVRSGALKGAVRHCPGRPADYAFSPTFNSAGSKRTPHPPIPQYPSGFFARYCW